jgi:three-Cys-motif partner protein
VKETSCRTANGNCKHPDADGLAVQCVHTWVAEKHDYLKRFIDASANPRRSYVTVGRVSNPAGAAFVDLFAGPGRARVQETGAFVDGSPLIALKHGKVPFSRVILVEQDPENIRALKDRVGQSATVIPGDCNTVIDKVASIVPRDGLNLALIDPYNVSPLSFETIARLGRFARMDLLIHFPTSDIRRKFGKGQTMGPGWHEYIDRFLGTTAWRSEMNRAEEVPSKLIPILREQLTKLGYEGKAVRDVPIRADARNVLYHLVYASKHPLGSKIWDAIARIGPGGQRSLL